MELVLVDEVVKCEKENTDFGKAIESVLENLVLAKMDGFQPGSDIPAVLLGSLSKLLAAADNAAVAIASYKVRPVACVSGILVPTLRGLDKLAESMKK